MSTRPKSDLGVLSEGLGFLVRRPLATLGLAAVGLLLRALSPLLQIKVGLPNEAMIFQILTLACYFPLQVYFIPRFLAEADAAAGGHAENLASNWKKTFDERWIRTLAALMLLGLGMQLGLAFLILPGLFIFFAFGWAPMKVLLRGEGISAAFTGSYRMMATCWRRVMVVAGALVGIYIGVFILFLIVVVLASPAFLNAPPPPPDAPMPIPDPWLRLTHPGFLAGYFLEALLNLWTAATLLALFRRLELVPVGPPEGRPDGN